MVSLPCFRESGRTETRGKLEDKKEGWKKQKGIMESPRDWEVARHGRETEEEIGEGVEGVWNSLLYSERC